MELKEFRVKHKLSAMKTGSMLGVERQTIYNWESGRSKEPVFLGRALNDWDRELSARAVKEKNTAALIKGCKNCYYPYDHATHSVCPQCRI